MEIYVVRTGDNVDAIASRFGADVQDIIFDNQLVYPYRLAVGQALVIRMGERRDTEDERDKREIESGGYAYPFISSWVLNQTLPNLSELSIFSYGFTLRGELVPPFADESWMISDAKLYQVRPMLTLTPLGEDGRFNNMLITGLLNNAETQRRLIWNLGMTVTEKGYGGINVDFEYILPEDRDGFSAFVERLTRIMNQLGYRVSVALAPKTSRNQQGLLYEGMDYGALGEAANEVFVMAYEWGYTYNLTDRWL